MRIKRSPYAAPSVSLADYEALEAELARVRAELNREAEHAGALFTELRAQLAGTKQACAELTRTAEGLLGDRERAMEADMWRIRCGDLEAHRDRLIEAGEAMRTRSRFDLWSAAVADARKDTP